MCNRLTVGNIILLSKTIILIIALAMLIANCFVIGFGGLVIIKLSS